MSQEVYIEQNRPLSVFDPGTTGVTVVDNADFTRITTVRCRSGYETKMSIGFDVQPGTPGSSVSFRVLVNGNPWTDDLFNSVTSRPAGTDDPQGLTTNLRDVPEGAFVEIQGKLTSAGADYIMYARPRVEYREKR